MICPEFCKILLQKWGLPQDLKKKIQMSGLFILQKSGQNYFFVEFKSPHFCKMKIQKSGRESRLISVYALYGPIRQSMNPCTLIMRASSQNMDRLGGSWISASLFSKFGSIQWYMNPFFLFENTDLFGGLWIPASQCQNTDRFGGPWIPA